MKKLRKLLKLVLVLAITQAFVIQAIAGEAKYKYMDEAKALNDLGLYHGISDGKFDPDLGTALDRQTGVVMLLRLFGKEDEALKMSDLEVQQVLIKFSDISQISEWARKQLAYAVKNGLVEGVTDTAVAPSGELNGKAYCTLILRQLGYRVNANDYHVAPLYLADKGAMRTGDASGLITKALTKDDLVGISYGTLKARDARSGKHVVQKLIEEKVIDEHTAGMLGFIIK